MPYLTSVVYIIIILHTEQKASLVSIRVAKHELSLPPWKCPRGEVEVPGQIWPLPIGTLSLLLQTDLLQRPGLCVVEDSLCEV